MGNRTLLIPKGSRSSFALLISLESIRSLNIGKLVTYKAITNDNKYIDIKYKIYPEHPSYRDTLSIFGIRDIKDLTADIARSLEGCVISYIDTGRSNIPMYCDYPLPYSSVMAL